MSCTSSLGESCSHLMKKVLEYLNHDIILNTIYKLVCLVVSQMYVSRTITDERSIVEDIMRKQVLKNDFIQY